MKQMLLDLVRWVWCYPVCVMVGHRMKETKHDWYTVRRCLHCPKTEVVKHGPSPRHDTPDDA